MEESFSYIKTAIEDQKAKVVAGAYVEHHYGPPIEFSFPCSNCNHKQTVSIIHRDDGKISIEKI